MSRHRPIRPGLAAVFAAMLALDAAAQESEQDEPVGWPLPPAEDAPLPADAPKKTSPQSPPEAKAEPAPSAPAPPRRSTPLPGRARSPGSESGIADKAGKPSPRSVPPDAGIGGLERIVLPIEPLSFSFRGERTALTRRETQALDRLAVRLRLHPEAIVVTGSASPERHGRETALRLALMRALAVRHYLIEEGAAEELIEVVASAKAESDTVTVAALEEASRAASQ